MVQRKQRLHSNCPMCNNVDETTTHILQCLEEKICTLKIKLITDLGTWLDTVDTQDELKTFICDGLASWLNSTTFYTTTSPDPSTQLAFNYQLILGRETLLQGYISDQIIQLQQRHYTSLQSRKTGIRWGVLFTNKLWLIIHQIWLHRNNTLHETEVIDIISGAEHLQEAIFLEHLQGLDNLPYVYASYFLTPLQSLFKKPITHLKQWFLVIRSGRECCDPNSYNDIFAYNTCLRKWVGLFVTK